MFICKSVNYLCILYDHKTKHLNIILLRHIIGIYRVTSNIYMQFMSAILL